MTIREIIFCALIVLAIGALYAARQTFHVEPACAAGPSPITDGTVYDCGG